MIYSHYLKNTAAISLFKLTTRYLLFLLCGIISILDTTEAEEPHESCAQVSEDFSFYSDELRTQIFFKSGRILPARNHDTVQKRIDVFYKGSWLSVTDEKFKLGKKHLCFTENKCAIVRQTTGLYSQADLKAAKFGLASEGQEYPIIGRFRSEKLTWLQVDLGDQVGWLLGQKVQVEERSCGVFSVGKVEWNVELELRQYHRKFESQYDEAFKTTFNQDLTTANDPSYVVDSISLQQAQAIIHRTKERHRFSAGVGYIQRTFRLKKYSDFRVVDNIPPDYCDTQDPTVSQQDFQDQLLSVPVQYSYLMIPEQRYQLWVGSEVAILYNFKPEYLYEYHIPCKTFKKKIVMTNPLEWHVLGTVSFGYRLGSHFVGLKLGLLHSLDMVLGVFYVF
ncbi:MAG: hypothetical protein NZ480_06335 [Bdellovibrionaceae bacterium]|nr:hypothetical protein [Pseudobdellovibrionaceae bacterium]MDW8189366.1 hypothetical protein [Pseudobdellovibrionaceae bacterium]